MQQSSPACLPPNAAVRLPPLMQQPFAATNLDDEDDVRIPARGGLAPTAQRMPILQSSSSLPTVSAHPEDSSSTADAQPMLSAVQPELPSTTAEIQQAVSSTESAPVLGRSQRQRTPNVCLSDYQTYAITHGVSPAIPNCSNVIPCIKKAITQLGLCKGDIDSKHRGHIDIKYLQDVLWCLVLNKF
ncbi:unnamed protein product [Cuscuta campestris]|uniref:Uncharacterized protein n=1 Tax=Cuscuta campestris TaxID=132261 RepID=A0A484NC71_9ASTE|nr:unnamed protein product [Cuscuta campestris]